MPQVHYNINAMTDGQHCIKRTCTTGHTYTVTSKEKVHKTSVSICTVGTLMALPCTTLHNGTIETTTMPNL